MRTPVLSTMLLGVLCLLWVGPVHGADKRPRNAVFALIMGVNRSVDADLKTLLYADDDAVRYQELFRALGARTQLLARLDRETTTLSPQAAAEALPPTHASLGKVVAQLASEIAMARERGVKTTLYVLYAGHGNVDGQVSYLTLEDARLSGDQLAQEILDPIAADENHLIVDACYSYLLVGERGPGGERRKVQGFAATSELGRRNNLGLLLSTSSGDESHEWGAFQAGIFSHEVRSGLYGAADLDGDGSITYAEIASFLERANQAIVNDKFRPHVFARASAASAQLLDLRTGLGRSLAVDGEFPSAHYLIEDQRGVRFLDFHNAKGRGLRLVRPGGASLLYLRNIDDGKELTVPASDQSIALVASGFVDPRVTERGAAHQAFSLIFSLPFDRASEELVAVQRLPAPAKSVSARKVILWSSGLASAAGVVAGGLLLWDASHLADEARSSSQQRAAQLNQGIHTHNVGAKVAFGVAGAALTAGAVIWFFTGRESKRPQLEVGLGQIRWSGHF
ncbi:MAG TPA: hypothetical protein VF550_18015 [Polyangia bacterium]